MVVSIFIIALLQLSPLIVVISPNSLSYIFLKTLANSITVITQYAIMDSASVIKPNRGK
jgi:hypothetical protein